MYFLEPARFLNDTDLVGHKVNVLYADLGTRSFFQIRSPPILIPWISIAHFADFQVRSSLNRSKKTSGSLLEKSATTLDRS